MKPATCTTAVLPVGTDTVQATYNGDSNHNSGSGSTTQTVNAAQDNTVTSLSSSLNPSQYNQNVTFTATVTDTTSPSTTVNQGTVTFTYSSTTLCSAVPVSSGVAQCNSSGLPIGTDSVNAGYSGGANFNSSSGSLNQTVNKISQTITVTLAPPASASYASLFNVSATASSGLTVAITTSGACSGSGSGSAAIGMTSGTGTCSVMFNQAGNGTYSAAPQVTDTTTATQASSPAAVTSSLNPSAYGQSVNFTATVRNVPNGATPTGTVQFSIDSAPYGTPVPMSGGSAAAGISTLAVGAHTVTATYSGDSNYSANTGTLSGDQVVTTAGAAMTIASSLNPTVYGQSVTFTATINGANGLLKRRNNNRARPMTVTGAVTWSDSNGPLTCTESGTSTTTVASGNPGTATCTTTTLAVNPSDTITGNYSGDANHDTTSATTTQTINASNGNVTVATSGSPSVYGQSVTFTATITGDNGMARRRNGAKPMDVTGSVTWSANTGCSVSTVSGYPGVATCTTATLSVGAADIVTANYSGDSNHNSGSGSVSQEVDAADSTVTVASSLNPSNYGQSVTFTATINGANNLVRGRKNGAKPMDVTGSVTWNVETGCGTTAVTPGNTGTATCTTSSLPAGTTAITATYSGDDNHGGSTGTLSGGQVVNQLTQAITFTTSPPSSATYNTSFTVAATGGASGNPVTFTAAGVCSITGGGTGTATYLMTSGTGTCSVIANQAGSTNYAAAPTLTSGVLALLADQTITVTTPAPATAAKGDSFTIVASASSGLPIEFTSNGQCTNVGAVYTITGIGGTCNEHLSQPGDSNYKWAGHVNETTSSVKAIAPTVSFTGAPATAVYESTFTVTATTNAPTTAVITASGPCSISGNTVTMTAGSQTCILTAKWPAAGIYSAATAKQTTAAKKAVPIITWPTPAPIQHGTSLTATQLDATANYNSAPVPGTFVYVPTYGTFPNVPKPPATCDTLKVTFTPYANGNFTSAKASVCLVVTP